MSRGRRFLSRYIVRGLLRVPAAMGLLGNRYRRELQQFFHLHGDVGKMLSLRIARRMSGEKIGQQAARSFWQIHKLNSRASLPVLPHHLTREPNIRRLARQLELK